MADYYADSSVLVKRHVRETGTDWFRALADPASGQVITTARISPGGGLQRIEPAST
jgi:uncharacterized protein